MTTTGSTEDLHHDAHHSHASKLFLETSMPSSASPYPSPSSAFYPPPIPASHEFANKLANNKRYRGAAGNVNLVTGGVGGLSGSANPGQPSATGTEAYLSATSATSGRRASDAFLGQTSSPVTAPASVSAPNSRRTSRQDPSSNLAKTSIKPPSEEVESSAPENTPIQEEAGLSNSSQHLSVDPQDNLLSPSIKSDSTLTPPPSTKRFSLTSLTSSRPAPPSPGPSRRPSLQRKNSSKRRSVHSNGSRDAPIMPLSTTPTDKPTLGGTDYASRRQSSLSMSFTAFAAGGGTEEQEEPTTPAPPSTSANLDGGDEEEEYTSIIIVRDFAYPEDDERFSKRPIESLPLNERPAVEAGQAHDREDGWDDDGDGDEWDHRWQYAGDEDGSGSITPLRDGSHAYDEDTQAHGYAPEEIDPDMPLPPGIYRAVYAFEAEGTAEMSLQEGDLVKVIGRGGGVGWAVVERGWKAPPGGLKGATPNTTEDGKSGGLEDGSGSGALALAGQALVPESYLEPYLVD